VYAAQAVNGDGPAGARFVISGWSRTAGTSASGGPVMIIAAVRNQDGTSSVTPLNFARGPHGWSFGSAVVTTTKRYTRVDVYARVDRQTGTSWFDNVRLSPADGSLSIDPGFENGALGTAWAVTGSGARDTTTYASGVASVRLGGAAGAVYAMQNVPVSGAGGRNFIVSGWNRTTGTSTQGGPVYLVAAIRNLDGSTTFVPVQFARGPHAWTYGEMTFTTPRAFGQIDLYARVDNQTGGSAWFDDVRLTPLG
jgi:hypothetical protein